MSDTLAIEVHMVKGNSKLGGIGEPRRLPMKPEVVREAIKQG